LQHIELFYDDLEYGVHAVELIKEIFVDNENLLIFDMTPLISRIATCINTIDIESTKKATLISFVPEFMKYKDEYQKDIQNTILTEFTTNDRKNLNFLYTEEEGQYNLSSEILEMRYQYYEFMKPDSKLMPEITVPPEMAYTMQFMMLIAASSMGKNA